MTLFFSALVGHSGKLHMVMVGYARTMGTGSEARRGGAGHVRCAGTAECDQRVQYLTTLFNDPTLHG